MNVVTALLALAAIGAERAPPTVKPELALDRDAPVLSVTIEGERLRLRVDFDQKDVVELNPAAAARLPLAFVPGFDAWVGRVRLPGRQARAVLTFGPTKVPAIVSEHGRDCCLGVDGAIGVDMLPYDVVRFRRAGAMPAASRSYVMTTSENGGLFVTRPILGGTLAIILSLSRERSSATAAGGSILIRQAGGQLGLGDSGMPIAFGVVRPVRLLRLARPVDLLGFAVTEMPVRTTDLRGHHRLPPDPVQAGEVVVRGRAAPQEAWPAVVMGRDWLDRCPMLSYRRVDRQLTLNCVG